MATPTQSSDTKEVCTHSDDKILLESFPMKYEFLHTAPCVIGILCPTAYRDEHLKLVHHLFHQTERLFLCKATCRQDWKEYSSLTKHKTTPAHILVSGASIREFHCDVSSQVRYWFVHASLAKDVAEMREFHKQAVKCEGVKAAKQTEALCLNNQSFVVYTNEGFRREKRLFEMQ